MLAKHRVCCFAHSLQPGCSLAAAPAEASIAAPKQLRSGRIQARSASLLRVLVMLMFGGIAGAAPMGVATGAAADALQPGI